jgi:hypothetical protein
MNWPRGIYGKLALACIPAAGLGFVFAMTVWALRDRLGLDAALGYRLSVGGCMVFTGMVGVAYVLLALDKRWVYAMRFTWSLNALLRRVPRAVEPFGFWWRVVLLGSVGLASLVMAACLFTGILSLDPP